MLQTNSTSIYPIIFGFLGVIIGSLISFLGLWLQNKAQDRRQQKAIEIEMRREIYFLGAEALGKMQSYLISFANPLIEDSEQNKIISGVIESINKVVMIASLEMIRDLDVIQSHYSSSVIKLITQKMEFKNKAIELQNDEQIQENLAQHLSQITAELNAANQQQDRGMQMSLIQKYKDLDSLFKEQEIQLSQRRHELLTNILEIIEFAVESSIKFDELSAPLNCKAREELGFPINHQEYSQMLENSGIRQRKLAKEWKEDWKTKFSETAKRTPFEMNF